MEEEQSTDWAWLPKNLLDSIVDNLVALSDYVRFSAVCKPWLFVALDQKKKRMIDSSNKGSVPMLLVPTLTVINNGNGESWSFYDAIGSGSGSGKFYNFSQLTHPHTRFCGSSRGWLATCNKDLVVTLFNPFSPALKPIHLPPLADPYEEALVQVPNWYEFFVMRLVLSNDPSLFPNDYEVAVIFGEFSSLAFIKSGDKAWSYRRTNPKLPNFNKFKDFTYYKGKLHVLDGQDGVYCIDFTSTSSNISSDDTIIVKTNNQCPRSMGLRYLVESSRGDLLTVKRFYIGCNRKAVTSNFEVSKLQFFPSQGTSKWVPTNCIGDDALFLGDSHSIAVYAPDHPGCKRNCIYFTDDETELCVNKPRLDMGVFNLEDRSIENHYTLDPSQYDMPSSVWILPKLQYQIGSYYSYLSSCNGYGYTYV